MKEVASLTEGGEVLRGVVRGIMVAVARREDDASDASLLDVAVRRAHTAHQSAVTIAPTFDVFVPPAAIAEVRDRAAMRPAAALAPSLGASEPDRGRQLAPIDRIEPAVVPVDRHGTSAPVGGGTW